MKTVIVHPERCIGCKQCEIACAVAHSKTKNLFSMLSEEVLSKPRIHVEVGADLLTFPNKCRHCNPAPCEQVCPTGALYRDEETGGVLIDYGKCISCAMCAIACPFGVITFGKTYKVDLNREVNVKCDNCIERQMDGKEPACVEACKTGALEFGEINELIAKSRKKVTFTITKSPDEEVPSVPDNIKLWRSFLKSMNHANR